MKNFEEKLEALTSDVKELWGRAYRDSLTQLLNRAALEDVVLNELRKLQQNREKSFALLFMDLNGFKNINDTFGHDTGDKLLIAVGNEIVELHDKMAFRPGGDEFIVIVPDCRNSDAAMTAASVIRDRISKTYSIDDHECTVASSIGVVFCDDRLIYSEDDEVAIREVIHNGDAAMYYAKMLSKTSLLMPDVTGAKKMQGRSYLFENTEPPKFKLPSFKSIARNGIGEGRLLVDGETAECNFKIVQFADGEILLSCTTNAIVRQKIYAQLAFKKPKTIHFEGVVRNPIVNSKCLISCHDLQEVGTSFQLHEAHHEYHSLFRTSEASFKFATDLVKSIRFYIANFRFPLDRFNSKDYLQIEIEEFLVDVGIFGSVECHEKQIEKLVDTDAIEVTAWAEINLKSGTEVNQAVAALEKVFKLLSFLQGSRTSWVSYDLLSKDNEVISSQCRHSIVSKLACVDISGLWTTSFIARVLPKMYRTIETAESKWNLSKIMAFLSTAQSEERYLETRAHKIIYCIELLLNAYLENCGQPVEDRSGLWSKEDFAKKLMELCIAIKIDCMKIEGKSHNEVLFQITNEIAILREHLHRDGTLNSDELHEDNDVMQRLGYERWRRTNSLLDFLRNCIKKILDPDGNHAICLHQISDERYDGTLKDISIPTV